MSILIMFLFSIYSCMTQQDSDKVVNIVKSGVTLNSIETEDYKSFFEDHPEFVATSFQFPVGPPNAEGYYNAQYFGINLHLGEDWNGVGGGDSDLGDAVFSIAKGYVYEAKDYGGGWGNVVRIIHKLDNSQDRIHVESIYAHLDKIQVVKGDSLDIGVQVGTIGNAHGAYLAHLHFELRDKLEMDIGAGYSKNTTGFLDPTDFIKSHRK